MKLLLILALLLPLPGCGVVIGACMLSGNPGLCRSL